MATTAWTNASSATKISGSWNGESASNLLTEDAQTVSWSNGPGPSCRVNNFGFSDLPDGSTIDGIEVRVKAVDLGSLDVHASQLYLQKTAGTDVGTNQGATNGTRKIPTLIMAFAEWAGTTNLWGTTWTTAELKASGFGVRMGLTNLSGKFSPEVYVDVIQARVHYTAAASTPTVSANSASAVAGVGGTVQMSATNTPTSWSLPGSPPTGVSVNSSGLVTWTSATPAGVHSITVRATNAGGDGDGTLTLTITAASPSGSPKMSIGTKVGL